MMIMNNTEETLGEFLQSRKRLNDCKEGIKYRYHQGVSTITWR